MSKTLLLTGATGFLGQWILHQELEETDNRLILPVRAKSEDEAGRRVNDLLHYRFGDSASGYAERTQAIAAQLDHPGLGFSEQAVEKMVTETTHIIHSAANVSWTMPLKDARAINVGGTAGIWDLATRARKEGSLKRAIYISTVGVAGRNRSVFYESERDVRQRFHNTYARSKWEAEHIVEQMRDRVPSTIVRPSAIVGESSTGVTEAWNAIYYVWRIYERYARFGIRFFPCDADTVIDPIPVDWLARACRTLLDDAEAEGLTLHLAQGFDRAPPAREVLGDGAEALGFPRPWFFPLSAFTPVDMTFIRLFALGGPFAHRAKAAAAYLELGQETSTVDCSIARRILEPHGLTPPPWEEFREAMFNYMARARLGRRAPETYPERRELALKR